jgi:putative ATP-dependent endonuclease of OLD family
VIGENDTGKTDSFSSLSFPLSGNQFDFNQKRLTISEINKDCVIEFFNSIINPEEESLQLQKIPKVILKWSSHI